jgi:hypothetical protein
MKKAKKTKTARIQDLLAQGKSQTDIARILNVSRQLVYGVARRTKENSEFVSKVYEKAGLKKPSKIIEAVKETKAAMDALGIDKNFKARMWIHGDKFGIAHDNPNSPTSDPVNHPLHYRDGGIETIDFIEAKDLNYRLGNVVKYVSRAGKKATDPIEDLKKAAWYLEREIAARERA